MLVYHREHFIVPLHSTVYTMQLYEIETAEKNSKIHTENRMNADKENENESVKMPFSTPTSVHMNHIKSARQINTEKRFLISVSLGLIASTSERANEQQKIIYYIIIIVIVALVRAWVRAA